MPVAWQHVTKTNRATKQPVQTAASGEIVFINQDTLLSKYDYFKDMTKRLEDKNKTATSDVDARRQALQREVADYQNNATRLALISVRQPSNAFNAKGRIFKATSKMQRHSFRTNKPESSKSL